MHHIPSRRQSWKFGRFADIFCFKLHHNLLYAVHIGVKHYQYVVHHFENFAPPWIPCGKLLN